LENNMARVFITGSSDGLGLMAGQLLADQGHEVVLHARNDGRATDAKEALPKAEAVVVGDLASIAATKDLAAQVNALGSFDAIIHNAAVGYREGHRQSRARRGSGTSSQKASCHNRLSRRQASGERSERRQASGHRSRQCRSGILKCLGERTSCAQPIRDGETQGDLFYSRGPVGSRL
jgi:NAD(P)-dependent dehydrogenase (short-subunit alcohol dehydrogenase family)